MPEIKERPILFSGEMVKAILEGRKTQTRRVVRPQPLNLDVHWPNVRSRITWGEIIEEPDYFVGCAWCSYGRPGDRLWVREAFGYVWPEWCDNGLVEGADGTIRSIDPEECDIVYRATDPDFVWMGKNGEETAVWKPSIHMPRWASRITLEIVNVRVERVRDIGPGDIVREGCPEVPYVWDWFRNLWDSINAKRGYGWDTDPWVWVIEFEQIQVQ